MKIQSASIGLSICASVVVLTVSLVCGKGNATESTNATDYSVASHWMSVPAVTNKTVDLFYLYPTAWTNSGPVPEYCAIDNPQMLSNAPLYFAKQATPSNPWRIFTRHSIVKLT